MRHHEYPNVGKWYQDREYDVMFEVVATDYGDDSIEIQHFSGAIEALDIETWYELDLKSIPAPEDWSGAYEVPHEDISYSDEVIHPENWCGPLNEIEPDGSH